MIEHAHAYTPALGDATSRRGEFGKTAVWFFRALLLIPFVLMGPEIVSLVLGRPGAAANVSASVADVLGTSTFTIFITMLAVTPVHTITGWRWHVILRRDYGDGRLFRNVTDPSGHWIRVRLVGNHVASRAAADTRRGRRP